MAVHSGERPHDLCHVHQTWSLRDIPTLCVRALEESTARAGHGEVKPPEAVKVWAALLLGGRGAAEAVCWEQQKMSAGGGEAIAASGKQGIKPPARLAPQALGGILKSLVF